jgi:hypothetical protein
LERLASANAARKEHAADKSQNWRHGTPLA